MTILVKILATAQQSLIDRSRWCHSWSTKVRIAIDIRSILLTHSALLHAATDSSRELICNPVVITSLCSSPIEYLVDFRIYGSHTPPSPTSELVEVMHLVHFRSIEVKVALLKPNQEIMVLIGYFLKLLASAKTFTSTFVIVSL